MAYLFDNGHFGEDTLGTAWTADDWLQKHVPETDDEINIVVGFFSLSQLERLMQLKQSDTTIRLIAQAELATGDRTIADLLKDETEATDLTPGLQKVYDELGESLFIRINWGVHAKAYLTADSVFIGSANLTRGGCQHNIELNIALERDLLDNGVTLSGTTLPTPSGDAVNIADADLDAWFDAVWTNSRPFEDVVAKLLELAPVGRQLVDLPVSQRDVLRRAYGIDDESVLEALHGKSLFGQLMRLDKIVARGHYHSADSSTDDGMWKGTSVYYDDLLQTAAVQQPEIDEESFAKFLEACPANPTSLWRQLQRTGRSRDFSTSVDPVGKLWLLPFFETFGDEAFEILEDAQTADPFRGPVLMTELWPNQQRALKAWLDANRTGIIEMATATGKTLVGVAAIADLCGYGAGHSGPRTESAKILILMHQQTLLDQWREELIEKFGFHNQKVAVTDDARTLSFETGRIEIQTPQYIQLNPGEFTDTYDLVIFDEVHHYSHDKGWGTALRVLDRKATLGLSALLPEPKRTLLEKRLGDIVYTYGLTDARADNLLPELDWLVHPIELTDTEQVDFQNVHRELAIALSKVQQDPRTAKTCEKLRDADVASRYGYADLDLTLPLDEQVFVQAFNIADRSEEFRVPRTWAAAMSKLRERRNLIYTSAYAEEQAVKLAQEYIAEGVKVIVFSMRVETARAIADSLPKATVVHGELQENKKVERIASFRTRDTGALVAAKLLDEGVDIPDADIGINVASTKSELQLIQRMGRLLRPSGQTKPVFHHFVHPIDLEVFRSAGPAPPEIENQVEPRFNKRLPEREGTIQFSQARTQISPTEAYYLLTSDNRETYLRNCTDDRRWLAAFAAERPKEFEIWLRKRAQEAPRGQSDQLNSSLSLLQSGFRQ